MRTDFQRQLSSLQADLGAMSALAGDAVGRATRGLLDVDGDAAREVTVDVERLRHLHQAVERRTLSILAKQAPVAGDLRKVVTAIGIAADADRMGGLALHVAKVVLRRHPESAIPFELRGRFAEMGSATVKLAELCRGILTTADPSEVRWVQAEGRLVETMHRELFGDVTSPEWPHGSMVAADVVLLGRFYGRFADHADEIARRMVFQASGEALARGQLL